MERQSGGVSAGDPYRGGQIQPVFSIGFSSSSAFSPSVGSATVWRCGYCREVDRSSRCLESVSDSVPVVL